MTVEKLVLGAIQTNCYIVSQDREALVIDPADEPERILATLERQGLKPVAMVATHAHFDHVLAVAALKEKTGAPFYLHREDEPLLEEMQERTMDFLGVSVGRPPKIDRYLEEGDVLEGGGYKLTVLHTPGHSPGGICLYDGKTILFSGDTLFAGSIGRPDLPGGSYETLIHSIQDKLLTLDADVLVHPGHGPSTTIGQERKSNPFLRI